MARRLRGAYGVCFEGIEDKPTISRVLLDAPDHWARVTIEHRIEEARPVTPRITGSGATILLIDGGHAVLDRASRHVVFHGPEALWTDWIVHPTLGALASVFANWLGHHSLHAGAVVLDGGAWGLLGNTRAGKSTTLGWLAGEGCPVLADDVTITDGDNAFAGPRTLDLVNSSAAFLNSPARQVGEDPERNRVELAEVEPEVPLRGWVALTWGAGTELRPIPPPRRLGLLVENLRLPMSGPSSGPLLELASLPAFELRRPRTLEALPEAGTRLLELAESA
jgi:hypothetical protein